MGYEFLKDKHIRKELHKMCMNDIYKVQNALRDELSFDIRLIGSGNLNLITVNGKNNHIDLDYNLIIKRDKNNLLDEPRLLREKFINAFNKIKGIKKKKNKTQVIYTYYGELGPYNFSVDYAIIYENMNGQYNKLIYDRKKDVYIWNLVKNSLKFDERVKELKELGKWNEVRELYLKKKEDYKSCEEYTSSMILMETVNEIYQE